MPPTLVDFRVKLGYNYITNQRKGRVEGSKTWTAYWEGAGSFFNEFKVTDMSYVEWKRTGEWLEDNLLIISGYRLTDKNEFIESPGISTIINPVDFDEFCSIEFNYKEVDGGIKFSMGEKTYSAPIPLFNSMIAVAEDILWDAVDTRRANESPESEDVPFRLTLV